MGKREVTELPSKRERQIDREQTDGFWGLDVDGGGRGKRGTNGAGKITSK